MSVLVRTEPISGYRWVDFYVDQGGRWQETVTWWPGAEGVGSPVDVTGYDCRFVVVRQGFDESPVLDLINPSDITVGDAAGTFSWDVPSTPMRGLRHPVYQHELSLMPAGNAELAFPLIKGRVIVRASVIQVPSPTITTGWGHGPWGLFPWGSP